MAYTLISKPRFAADFKQDARKIVGHLVSLKLDGEELTPDFNFRNPEDPNSYVKMCGILTWFEWDLKKGGTVRMEGRIPYTNKGIFHKITVSPDRKAECAFKINWYEYDVKTGTYFKCCSTDDKVFEGQTSFQDPAHIDNEKVSGEDEYTQIDNYAFSMTLLGSDKKDDQAFQINYGKEMKDSILWGQKVGG